MANAQTIPTYLRAQQGGVVLAIKLQPRASSSAIAGVLGNELRVKVTAPPVDAAANEALLRLLANALGVSRGKVELIRGQTSRHKTVLISGMSLEAVALKLSSFEA